MRQLAQLNRFRTDLAQVKVLLESAARHLNRGEAEAAIEDAQSALRLWQEDPVAYYLRGLGWEQKGNSTEARVDLEKAINSLQLRPGVEQPGSAAVARTGPAGAKKAFDRALELSPELPEAHYNRGLVAAGEEDLARAAKEFQEALALNPEYLEAHLNLGLVLQRQKQLDSAVAQFRAAVKLRPDLAEAHNDLGLAMLQPDTRARRSGNYGKV